jgi:hypothetical protein
MNNCLASFLGILAFASFSSYLHAQEYSTPVEYNEFDANIGVQQVAEVVHPWVGPTPQELAPGVIALGSLQDKKYIHQSPAALENELSIIPSNIPPAAPIPIPGWVGQTPQELAPNAVPLGSLANRRLLWLGIMVIYSPKDIPLVDRDAPSIASVTKEPSFPPSTRRTF